MVVGHCAWDASPRGGRLAAEQLPPADTGVLYPSRDWGPQCSVEARRLPVVPGPGLLGAGGTGVEPLEGRLLPGGPEFMAEPPNHHR